MWSVLGATWALLLGMGLLMIGNGAQATLMGVRGGIEGFSTFGLSLITSAYFVGFLFGSRLTPEMIRRVGHVRVFAALGSFFSATLVLFPVLPEAWSWILLRVFVGFCFSGLYVTAESWLNNATDSSNRGTLLSLYMIMQTGGIVAAQALVNVADPGGFIVFILPSVLVSLSFAPILLAVQPTPGFSSAKPMSFRQLYSTSPLGFVATMLLGAIFSGIFGMSSIWGSEAGLSVAQISTFVATIFVGSMILQLPIGALSDRMDRRKVILGCAVTGALAGLLGFFSSRFELLLVAAFLYGGMANPLYSLVIAYVNDWLDYEDMASASGRLLFINGIGAITGPLLTGFLISLFGEAGFWLYLLLMMAALAGYTALRMSLRPETREDDSYQAVAYAPVMPTATPVTVEAVGEWYVENADTNEDSGTEFASAS